MQDKDFSISLSAGTRLQNGRYIITRVLGKGGFGITYEATMVRLQKRVAIKEYFVSGVCGRGEDGRSVIVPLADNQVLFERQRKRFNEEADKLAHLSNPHLVSVHDLFDENNTSYYVMDFIEGQSLSSKIQHSTKPLSEAEVITILDQMLDALNCIHSQTPPLCHLDIKPANIMVNDDGHAVLIDFGASKYATPAEGSLSLSSVIYTPSFAPVEQLSGNKKNMGPWTDFYALGATLYTMLTFQKPAEPSDILADQTPEKTKALPLPRSVSPRLRNLILWMMSFDKAARPKSVGEIQEWMNSHGASSSSLGNGNEQTFFTDVGKERPNNVGNANGNGHYSNNGQPVRKKQPILLFALLASALLVIGGYWLFQRNAQLKKMEEERIEKYRAQQELAEEHEKYLKQQEEEKKRKEEEEKRKKTEEEEFEKTEVSTRVNDNSTLTGKIGPYQVTMYLKDLSSIEVGDNVGYYIYNERPTSKLQLVVNEMETINTSGSMKLVLKEYAPSGLHSGTFDGQYECRGDSYFGSFTNYKGEEFQFSLE